MQRILAMNKTLGGGSGISAVNKTIPYDITDPRHPGSIDYLHEKYDWGLFDPFYDKSDIHKEC